MFLYILQPDLPLIQIQNMKEDFNYKEVPYNYIHCLHAQCRHSDKCLRYLITRYADPKIEHITIVNPSYALANEDNCSFFHEDRMSCFACGITHIFDNLPYKQALKVKKLVYNKLRRNTYYRIKRKERLINPEEISLIREIFRNEGIKDEPAFDELIYKYDW